MSRLFLIAAAFALSATSVPAAEPDALADAPHQPVVPDAGTFDAALPAVDRLPSDHWKTVEAALNAEQAEPPIIAAVAVTNFERTDTWRIIDAVLEAEASGYPLTANAAQVGGLAMRPCDLWLFHDYKAS